MLGDEGGTEPSRRLLRSTSRTGGRYRASEGKCECQIRRKPTEKLVEGSLSNYPPCLDGVPATRFGDGTTSASDGMRFGVASSALNARHNPPFFARRRGVTLYSHSSKQGPQFWIDVVNCLMREATYVLDGLVYQDVLPIH
jgi:hypothetical protein